MADVRAPFIVDYLLDKFAKHRKDEAKDMAEAATAEEGYGWVPTRFSEFCREFMNEHRPSTMQNVEGNYIITLTSGDEVSVAPPFVSGDMQRGGRAIPVTGMATVKEILKAGGPMGGR